MRLVPCPDFDIDIGAGSPSDVARRPKPRQAGGQQGG